MKIVKTKVYEGKNIYSHKKCIRIDVDLNGYADIPSKDIEDFNINLVNMIPELRTHRCGIDEDEGFVKRLKEGTYLAHICEHIIIAIQNKIGINKGYGKAREIHGDNYYIVFQYEYAKTGVEVAKLAVDIINSLIDKKTINYDERIKMLENFIEEEEIGPSTKAILDSALIEGLPIIRLDGVNFHQIGYGRQGRVIEASIGSRTSCVSVDIASDKMLTKELLHLQNIPVARGVKVNDIISCIKDSEEIGYPVVLKPQYGNKGNGVILNIKNKEELVSSYEKLKDNFSNIILEKYYTGNDYRVCVINYNVVAVALRTPPFIIGDGKSSVIELIEKLNSNPLRGKDHEKPLTKVKVDSDLIDYINEQGKKINDILKVGEKINLRQNANLSTGGEAQDYTEEICEENKNLCIRAAKTLGLDICGIDICTNDIAIPIYNDNGVIIEVNAAPGLRMHIHPNKGKSRDVGKEIINMLYDNNPVNIPVVSITGTNGKTTTTRVISHTLSKAGYNVGMTSTEGIYINGCCIDNGDDTGVESAKGVLLNRDVEVAVLETARGGIIKKGLAYDEADVAIITNITEDHLGIDGIDTMEDLCNVKSLVAEAVKKNGYVVLNADDKWSKTIIDRVKSNKIFFSKDKDNQLIQENIKNGGIAVYIEEDNIIVSNNYKKYTICNITEIPITLNGKLSFNIENILGVCGALVGLKVDYCMIKNGIQSYSLNSAQNIGRFNCYDVNGINVILDYGHNIEGYKAVLSSIKKMNTGNIYGIIGIPGDRSDKAATEIGILCSKLLDYIIIKEDKDRRGRKQSEIADIILKGAITHNSSNKTEVVLDEVEAFERAFKRAKRGDTIIVFFEKIQPLLKVIDKKIKEYLGEDNIKVGY